jgi:uncharacterized protein YbjT (DUF2867 family)
MTEAPRDVVTGAFSFTGRYVAERLLARGRRVTTLTNHPGRTTPFSEQVHVEPYRFDDVDALAASLDGAETLYNTFWIRDVEAGPPPGNAVRYSRRLVRAAEAAGVKRIVHFSVANATASELPYHRAKARVERVVADADLSHAILRPTLVFGVEDLLVNNLAWMLRRLPVFAVLGDGDYQVQPVHVGDVADCAVEQGLAAGDRSLPVAGPETYSFDGFVRTLADHLGSRSRLLHVPPRLGLLGVRALELLLRDSILSGAEARMLMDGLLAVDAEPVGGTGFEEWLEAHADQLGTGYTSFRERYDPGLAGE